MATDVAELEALAKSESIGDLRRAAELYAGDLLDGISVHDPGFEDWLASERARLREVTIGVLGRLTAGLAQSYFCQKGLAVSLRCQDVKRGCCLPTFQLTGLAKETPAT